MKKKSKKPQEDSNDVQNESVKPIGLFDHVKHIREVQNVDYYKNLSESDRKSFNHFMILRALSMNPTLVDDISKIFQYFDSIPSEQLYKVLISLIPSDRRFYPWVKSKREKMNSQLLELIAKKYEISTDRANEYILMLMNMEGGVEELVKICQGYGLNDKEVERIFSNE
jgi:hypothetical protein